MNSATKRRVEQIEAKYSTEKGASEEERQEAQDLLEAATHYKAAAANHEAKIAYLKEKDERYTISSDRKGFKRIWVGFDTNHPQTGSYHILLYVQKGKTNSFVLDDPRRIGVVTQYLEEKSTHPFRILGVFTKVSEAEADTVTYELKEAFELVQDPDDWRNPINTVLKCGGRVKLIRKAIRHFTATEPQVDYLGDDKFRFTSPGYRMGPAGP